ncbi:MAG: glycosyltransferase family 4 protein [Chloroherpetonaceae bacterium]
MKVFFFRTEYFGATTEGGSLAVTKGFTDGLLKLGHVPIVAANRALPLSQHVKQYTIPYPAFFKNLPEVLFFPYNRKSFREAQKIIKREQPNFLYQRHSIFNYAGALLKREMGIPFLLQVEGSEVWVKKNWGKTYFAKALEWSEEIQFEQADAIVVVSSVLKSQLVELGASAEKITVIPNGVDAERYSPDISGEAVRKKLGLEEAFVIGYAGTFGHWHGITVLAKAVKEIVGSIPKAHVLLIGDGVLRGEVEAILRKDGVQHKATITGMMPSETVPEYLAACDALVISAINNPDVPFFQSPIKLFEYMAMQKPVVASRVGQIQEVIQDGVNGLLVEENAPSELAAALCRLAKDESLCRSLAKNARRDVVEKYAWQENARSVLKVYETVTKQLHQKR